jgi:DNA-binding LacI/PurR family transcriptional regulator
MASLRILSASEQVAAHLHEEIKLGNLATQMPGIQELASQLQVNHKTVQSALIKLENQGILEKQGPRQPRKIKLTPHKETPKRMRIAVLLYEISDQQTHYITNIRYALDSTGYSVQFASKSMIDMKFDINRISQLVKTTQADAWIIVSGTRPVLDWFSSQPFPALAISGRLRDVPISGVGPDKPPACRAAVKRLIELGHRRIVLLSRGGRRLPTPGLFERTFLHELENHGIQIGPYNLPEWENNKSSFFQCLDSLFQATPPTALLIDEAPLFIAALQHLARQGIVAPDNVSMACVDSSPIFEWCSPSIAHIHWNSQQVARQIVQWANKANSGKTTTSKHLTPAKFIPGETIGPVRKSSN